MFDFAQLKNADILVRGGFVAIIGLIGVFLVLVLFFFLIKLMQKLEKKD